MTTDERSLLEFPCDFPIKVMGEASADFAQMVVDTIRLHVPEYSAEGISIRPSSAGRYIAVTCTVHVTHRALLDDIYRALSGHPRVKIVL